ncbi:MAG: aspartate kinase [Planctomycetota bacterium]
MKFGGTSLGDAPSLLQVVEIVHRQLARHPVVVVSAHAGVTDGLLALASAAATGAPDPAAIEARHRDILHRLGLPGDLLDPLLDDLRDLVRGLRLVGNVSPRAVDLLLSFGERLSARTVAGALRVAGIPATAVDAFRAGLRTDSAFGRARPLPDDGRIARAIAAVEGVPVITGFVAADEHGNITTLGRNGSDYSAALFGAALGAEEIQIWKDVDGVRTADPRLVPGARSIRSMTFEEACELSSFGSKVLHPASMLPAMQGGIPVLVRNTREPSQPGTRIEVGAPGTGTPVVAIAHRRGAAALTVGSRRLMPQHAFLARLFATLDGVGCAIGPVAVSEAAVVVVVDAAGSEAALPQLAELGDVRIERDLGVVGVVGDAEALANGAAGAVLDVLAAAGIPVRCASLGARGSTVSLVLADEAVPRAVVALHARFFAGAAS